MHALTFAVGENDHGGQTDSRRLQSGTALSLLVRDVPRQIEFLTKAFGAREIMRTTGGSGGTHAEVRIGESVIMMGGDNTPGWTPMPSALYVYCDDVDDVYRRALAAGGNSLEEPADKPYGDRVAGVKDFAGNSGG